VVAVGGVQRAVGAVRGGVRAVRDARIIHEFSVTRTGLRQRVYTNSLRAAFHGRRGNLRYHLHHLAQ
jgi:hypothetical protein